MADGEMLLLLSDVPYTRGGTQIVYLFEGMECEVK